MQIHHRPALHPLLTAAAVSVIVVSVLGIASLTGVLPMTRGATSGKPVVFAPVSATAALAPVPTISAASAASGRPVKPAETLAPGETLVSAESLAAAKPLPSVAALPPKQLGNAGEGTPSVARHHAAKPVAILVLPARPALASRTPTLPMLNGERHPRQQRAFAATTSGGDASGESASGPPQVAISERTGPPRITPVYRPTGPGDGATFPSRAPIDDPDRQRSAPEYRGESRNRADRSPSYRRAASRDGGGIDPRYSTPSSPTVASDAGDRNGMGLGRTVGETIDRTISFIASALASRPAEPQIPVQPAPYSQGAFAQ